MSYWSDWRAAHPEYRERDNARRAAAKRERGRGDRSVEYARQRERRRQLRALAAGDNGTVAHHHPLLEMARSIAARFRRPDHRSHLYRPTHEDAASAAVVALVAGEDPEAAARAVVREDTQWLHRTVHGSLVLLEDQEHPLIWMGDQ